MPKRADDVLRSIEEQAKSEFLPVLSKTHGDELERLVRERAPKRAIEIGVLTGYATIRIARNLPDGGTVTGIEISGELARRAEANIALAGLADKVTILRGDARELLDGVEGPIDLVCIDAERGQYFNYLKKIEPKLAKGAIVIAAGAGNAAGRLERYFDHVRLSGMYDSRHYVLDDDGIEVSTRLG